MAHTKAVGQLALPNVLTDGASARAPRASVAFVGAQGLLLPRSELDADFHPWSDAPESPDAPVAWRSEPLRMALERKLQRQVGPALRLTVTDNRRTMLSIKRARGGREVRLHHMFLDAPADVIEAVARYLSYGDPRAGERIDAFINERRARIRPADLSAPKRHPTQGEVHDLVTLRDDLSARYFSPAPEVGISWARPVTGSVGRGPRRTMRMGTYYIHEQMIRIHPALDQVWVPRYFVDWVIFHEMLHHVVPMPVVNGRRCYHTPEFRARELEFHDHERARQWEQWNIRRLIASRDP